jgi:hypothetical protein
MSADPDEIDRLRERIDELEQRLDERSRFDHSLESSLDDLAARVDELDGGSDDE